MAGPSIRTLALAHELSKICPVDVIFDGEIPDNRAGDINYISRDSVEPGSEFFNRYRAALVPPLVAMTFPEILDSDIPIAVDLFDPVIWENLELYRSLPVSDRNFHHERHLAALHAGLLRGDYFLAAGNRQQDLFTGALMALNRVNPSTWQPGVGIEQLVGLVPFGLPDEPPPDAKNLPLPENFKTAGPLVVWGGGMWDWLKPEILVKAWPEILAKFPDAKLAFPGTKHPNPHVPAMESVKRVKELAGKLGISESIIFSDWLSRDEYLGLLARADVGVSAHGPGLESRYAVRTRFLDAIWVGLPMVVSGGDEYSYYMDKYSIGYVIDPSCESPAIGFSEGIIKVLENGEEIFTVGFESARRDLIWEKMARPIIEWAKSPRLTHGPGAEFFVGAIGKASSRGKPTDLGSLMHRIISKIRK